MKFFKYILKKQCKITGRTALYNTLTRDLFISDTSMIKNGAHNELLRNRGFLIQKNLNDSDIANYYIRSLKYQSDWASFYLFITSRCNFNCNYCFAPRGHKEWGKKECIDSINFIKNIAESKNINFLNIYFMGGEPLLNLEAIKHFNNEFELKLGSYSQYHQKTLITNGFYLNKKTVKLLKKLNINSAQVTLDGDENNHNLTRNNHSKNSYKTIINNIKQASDEIEIFVRVNVTSATLGSLTVLLDELIRIDHKISKVIISPVIETTRMPSCISKSLLEKNIQRYLRLNNIIKNYGLETVFPAQGACPEFFEKSYSISSDGNIFSCPCFVENNCLSIGSISHSSFSSKYPSIISYERWQECTNCEFMIMCLGGCRYRASKENNDINSNYCSKELLHAISNQMLEREIFNYDQ